MTDVAISADGLWKQYQLGQLRPHDTLRDYVASLRRRRPTNGSARETFWALRDVSLELSRGEVLGIVGPNGAGKSTLLKILSRITEPTRGRAEINGRVGSLLEVGTGFHGELTGRENIFLNGSILGMKRAEIARKFDDIVDFAEIPAFIDTPVKRYSSGMYMRLAFSVAAHLEPEILLVDEVLAVGDVAFQRKCLGKMGEVSREGRTVLFVSHNLPAIRQLCTQGLLLRKGEVVLRGAAGEVIERYVAEYEANPMELFFEPRDDTPAFFRRIAVRNSRGEKTSRLEHSQPFEIEFEYEVRRPIKKNRLYWICDRADGTHVIASGTDDSPIPFAAHHEPGRYLARMRFPGGLLNSGHHTFRMEIRPESGFSYDYKFGGGFEILDDTDYAGLMPGGFRNGALLQRLEWAEERL